ncbi:MAG: DUF6785 family protein [Armatimonadota bacterium]
MHEATSSVNRRIDDSGPARAPKTRFAAMLVLSLVLTWLAGYWIRQAEIVSLACQITEAVPSIPGLAALLLLLAVNPLLLRLSKRWELSSGEIVVVYLFVTVATTMYGCGIVRFLIASLSAPHYYSTPAAPLAELALYIPSWLAPANPLHHRWLYEGAPTGAVPWDAWLTPIVVWTGFFVLFGGTLMSLMLLYAETWIHHERLVFPVVRLPVEILSQGTAVSFFRNPATWIGIGLATLLNVINMIRGVFFGGPSGGLTVDIGKQLTDYPLRALQPLQAHLRPELIGLGYLVSTELSFSIWFFYVFHKLLALGFTMAGYRLSGLPFEQEQGIGAYLVLAVVLLWKGRTAVAHAWRGWFEGEKSRGGAPSHRWALLGALLGFAGLLVFMIAARMQLWLAFVYMAILLMVGLVYARIRAETGVPLVWAFPYGQQSKVLWYVLGQKPVIGLGPQYASATIFALMGFMSRGYFPTVSGYQIEGVRLGEQLGINWRQITYIMLLAIGFGAATGMIFHLQTYYAEGGVGLRGGIWGASIATQDYTNVLRGISFPAAPDGPRIAATAGGGVLIALLSVGRSLWFGFPLHPVGYAVACAYGNLVWAPFLLVWITKTVLLRYGGSQSYLRALPGFLGFALGHFITAGLIWGTLAAALGGPFLRWGVWFG